MNFSSSCTIIASIALCIAIYSIQKAILYKKKLDEQTGRAIQLYLDKKFISKLINAIVEANATARDILDDLTDEIKEYFHFLDVIIYSPDRGMRSPQPGVYIKNLILSHLKSNEELIFSRLSKHSIAIDKIDSEELKCSLYISSIPTTREGRQLVAFVHYNDAPLERYDLETISRSISGLLASAVNLRLRLNEAERNHRLNPQFNTNRRKNKVSKDRERYPAIS